MKFSYIASINEEVESEQLQQDFDQQIYSMNIARFMEYAFKANQTKKIRDFGQEFLLDAMQLLLDNYQNNKNEYKKFLQSAKTPIFDSSLCMESFTHYAICHFLPSYWLNKFTVYYTAPGRSYTDFLRLIGFTHIKDKSESYYHQIIQPFPSMIELNPYLAEEILKRIDNLESLEPKDSIGILASLIANPRLNITQETQEKLAKDHEWLSIKIASAINEEASHVFSNHTLRTGKNYSLLSSPESQGKVLIIRGYDHNEAFKYKSEFKLLAQSNYDVLLIDAKKGLITLENIIETIEFNNFSDFEYVIIQMHGGNHSFILDTELSFNNQGSQYSDFSVMASDLLKKLMFINGYQPIKLFLGSCHSQLATHKLGVVLAEGSEIITAAEDQYVSGEKHTISATAGDYMDLDEIIKTKDLRKGVAISNYYQAVFANHTQASPTYAKIGVCNFRTAVNLSQKDVTELLSKTTEADVVNLVSIYLDKNGDEKNKQEIRALTKQLLDLFKLSANEHPLLEYRSKPDNAHYQKYLGIAGAIYAIYDQCGNGLISDSDFKPLGVGIREIVYHSVNNFVDTIIEYWNDATEIVGDSLDMINI